MCILESSLTLMNTLTRFYGLSVDSIVAGADRGPDDSVWQAVDVARVQVPFQARHFQSG